MFTRIWPVATVLLGAALGLTWADDKPTPGSKGAPGNDAPAKEAPAKEAPGKDVFGLTKVHDLHLDLTAKEWERMQKVTGGMRFPFGGAPKAPENKDEEPIERHKGAGFGTEYPWAHADLSEGEKVYKNVGLRYKGNASYMASSRGLKRNFKIDLDHYDDKGRYHGLKTLNLNAGAMDPSRTRESLAFSIFRAAGVPAPRTAYAQLTVTVPGKYDKEFVGLYTVIEQIDKTFLKDRFKDNKGLLVKPERLRGLEYLGEDWDRYKEKYNPKHEPSKEQARRLIEFVKLVNKADDDEFRKQIDGLLDIDIFLRYIAVNAYIANLDSFLMLGHNYYIYLDPTSNKFVFLPWDLDLSFAGFGMAGSSDKQMDLSLVHPYPGSNKLIERILAIPDHSAKYQKLLKVLAATSFDKENLLKDIEALEKVTKEPLEREKKAIAARKDNAGWFGGGMFGKTPTLSQFVEKRTESVAAQIDGKSKGYIPAGFGMGRPGGFGMGNPFAKPLLEAMDTNKDAKLTKDELSASVKKFFASCDKDNKGEIDEKTLIEAISKILPPPPGGPGGPGGPPPGGLGGPGAPEGPGGVRPDGPPAPGTAVAAAIFKRANIEKDGKLTLDKLQTAADALFKEIDKSGKGELDERGLGMAINALMPPPRQPPGGRPGERPGQSGDRPERPGEPGDRRDAPPPPNRPGDPKDRPDQPPRRIEPGERPKQPLDRPEPRREEGKP